MGFVYPGRVPFSFVRIQSVGENADRFFDEDKNAANGEYAVSYEVVDRRRLFNVIPFCPQPARAKVEVFIRKGEHPKVVAVTQALTQDLDHVTEERAVARRTYHRMRDEGIALQRVTEEHRDVIATHEQRKAALHSKIETLTGQLTEEVGALAELRKDLELRSVAIKQVESDLELAKGLSEIVGRQLDGEGPEDNEAGAWCNQTAELAQLWDTFWSGQATAQGWQGAGQVLKLEGPKD